MSWPVSDDYRAAVTRSHRIATRVEVLRNGSTQQLLEVAAGTIDIDATQTCRRQATIPLLDRDGALVPGVPGDLLHIDGNELRLWRGIDFGDDRAGIPSGIAPRGVELVPLITGPLFETEADDQGPGIALSLQIYDRARYVMDNRWDDPYAPAAGTLYTTAILAALADRLPASLPVLSGDVDTTTLTTPPGLGAGNNADDDPMATLSNWATAIGMDLSFDPMGNPTLRAIPDPDVDAPVVNYSDTRHELLSVTKTVSRERVYNRVVVTGEGPGGTAPVRGIALNDDPASPSYYLGPMGVRTFEYQSTLITTTDQATATARSLLLKHRGIAETIGFGTLVDGSLAAYDLIGLQRARMKIDARYLIETLTVPLEPETASSARCRLHRTN